VRLEARPLKISNDGQEAAQRERGSRIEFIGSKAYEADEHRIRRAYSVQHYKARGVLTSYRVEYGHCEKQDARRNLFDEKKPTPCSFIVIGHQDDTSL
jgi:hypothetical protein